MTASTADLSVHDKLLLIRSNGRFSSLDAEARALLAQHCVYRYFHPGDYLTRADRPLDEVHILLEGSVDVKREDGSVFTLDAPGGVGWPSFISRRPPRDITARTGVGTLAFGTQVLDDFHEANFSLVRNGIRLISADLLEARGGLPLDPGPLAPLGPYPETPATFVERIQDLGRTPLFADTSIEAAAQLVRRDREVRYDEGHVLWRRGEPADWGLRLVWGRVRCVGADGAEVVVGAPFALGSLGGLAQRPRAYDAIADTRLVAYLGRTDDLLSLFEDYYTVSIKFMAMLSDLAHF